MSGDRPPANYGFATEQVHGGFTQESSAARITPVYMSNGFLFNDFEQAKNRFSGDEEGFFYSRYGNPTVAAVERKLAGLERGVDAVSVASGQAALTVALMTLLSAGDHIIAGNSMYEGTRGLLKEDLARFGVTTSFVANPSDPVELAGAILPSTKVIFLESIPNPLNDVPDFDAVAAVAKAHGLALLVDNTLATPYLVRPFEHGADVVVHSTSKYLSGHGSSLGGVVIDGGTLPDFGSKARDLAARLGTTFSPFNAFLLQQGMETLSLRMERQSANALKLASWLEAHPAVSAVQYCGLTSNASHRFAQKYLPRGSGALLTCTFRGGQAIAEQVINRVRLFSHMTHLGDVRSLIMHPASTTHTAVPVADLESRGILPGTVRICVGIEEFEDLQADLEQALAGV